MSTESTAEAQWWHCWALDENGAATWFAVVESDRFPAREEVSLPQAEAAEMVAGATRAVASLDRDGEVVSVSVHGHAASRIPGVWYYEVPDPDAEPPAINVIAFDGHGVPPGSLLRGDDLGDPEVTGADQLGAVRWSPGTGLVDQVYVQPAARRQRLASALVAVVAALAGARQGSWPTGDSHRTDLGETWRNAQSWAAVAPERTHRPPPMTPGDVG